jgi:hypothetical protein
MNVQLPFFSVRSAGGQPFQEELKIPAGEEERGICPCCPTASAVAADGTVYVTYRNLLAGHRDMFVAKWTDKGLESTSPVVEPTWQFDGCPHDGPSLAVVGDTLHIVWMDGRTGEQRVYYGTAATADKASDEPAATTSHEHRPVGSGRAIMFAFAPHGGEFGPATAVLKREGRFQTRPAVIGSSEGKFVVAFNELDEQGKRVVVVRQPLQPPPSETETSAIMPAGEGVPADE